MGRCSIPTPPTPPAASALRAAAEIAGRLGAAPILADVQALARDARISLDEPVGPPVGTRSPGWSELTTREQDVLAHLVAGRTYPEIAAALFISEKTVSSRVSNTLRKTGMTSRLEVAELARRTPASTG